ncbi:MAG: molybdopterin-dependent oxidoreductase [Marivibrio sp.]|uniref:molybdopterin-containing oxidoreductase family protein n=1 Tax=Marivibrio sp. TaxID=2039719 RepID=UPI0032EEB85B
MTDATRIPAFCTQCRSRCGCIAVIEGGRLTAVEPDPRHPSGAKLCPKGRAAPELVHHPDRLTRPLRRVGAKGDRSADAWAPISWDEALDEIGARLGGIRDAGGPEQVAFSVTTPSGTHMSDSIAWVERFIAAFGSPNTIYSTEICNWHKDVATRFTYGWDIGTPDVARADVVLLWGWNPTATWLARSVEIQKALKRGAKLVVVDPRPTLYSRHAASWLRVRPGADRLLALCLARALIDAGRIDGDFLTRWTDAPLLVRQDIGRRLRGRDLGWTDAPEAMIGLDAAGRLLAYDPAEGRWLDETAAPTLDGAVTTPGPEGAIPCRTVFATLRDALSPFTPERACAEAGVDRAAFDRAAELIGGGGRVAYYAWNGVGQSADATQTDRAISILYALTGCYGAAGGNVPGAAASFNPLYGPDLLGEAQRAKALGRDARPLGPAGQGWVTAEAVYDAILERRPYPVRALVSFGGNLLAAQPETARARQALEALDLHVHADFFLNETAAHADIVLPAATSWEREGLRPGFDASLEGLRRVQLRPAVVEPVGEARGDTEIVMAMAERLGLSAQMFDGDVDAGYAHILAPTGLTPQALRAAPEGVTLPDEVRLRPFDPDGFPTPSKRLELFSDRLAAAGYDALPCAPPQEASPPQGYPLRLGCAKTLTYCHSQGRNLPSLRRLQPDPILQMAPETAAEYGLAEGDWTEVRTASGRFAARAAIVKQLAPGAVYAQHGWAGAGPDGSTLNLNAAMSVERRDPISGSLPLRAGWCALGTVEFNSPPK